MKAKVEPDRVGQRNGWCGPGPTSGRWPRPDWPASRGRPSTAAGGCPARYQRILDTEARAFQVPPRSLEIGLGMCGPTMLAHASYEQKRAFIPPLLRGEHVWCELFSEPGAGSDLSSVQTRAARDGDEFVVDGQKVWTSGAQHSDYAACLTRTDSAGPSARASRCSSSTCTHRASRCDRCARLTGDSHFNEVFLDAVRVPVATWSARRTAAGGWRAPCWPSNARR